MNIMQAAKHVGVSDKTIRRAIHAGHLHARYPQHNRAEIDVSDLEQWYTTTTIRATPDETHAGPQ
jgi:excisionase family DNA binding protein